MKNPSISNYTFPLGGREYIYGPFVFEKRRLLTSDTKLRLVLGEASSSLFS